MHQLQIINVSKSFPGVRALEDVSFDVGGGVVHALLGENGAGKSTLLKILSGAYRADRGTVQVDGQACRFHSPSEAFAAGIAVIYQELHLVPQMSVAENFYLGHLPSAMGWVRRGKLLEMARAQLASLGEDINPRAKISSLSIAQQQMIEIAKALTRDARVIAFDEPTSSLSSREVDRLFEIIGRLRDQGRVILYVTHRMEEVYRICGAATVLRDGRHVKTFSSLQGVTQNTLVSAMVGRLIADVFNYSPRPKGEAALLVAGLIGPGVKAPVNLEVARGEIVGIFGLVGAGRTELLKLIYGATRSRSGSTQIDGQAVSIRSPGAAIAAGMALCPEDRKREGIIPIRSVMENINLTSRRHFSPLGLFINNRRERKNASHFIGRLGIRTPSLGQKIKFLSGGNQQKAILGRWLGENLKVLLLDEPTRGIDVGAKSEIYSIIYELARKGVGVLLVSSELPEVLGVCDRVLVMRQGKIVADLARSEASAEKMLHLALPVGDPQGQGVLAG
ncbi:MAG: L-arabinose ABC transporter ATP-binding protein AraG [Planctomycetota bacterium]|nr:L-arabinose ABC transporter ATP-binding protein AraG [Planctomycetota bacterium]